MMTLTKIIITKPIIRLVVVVKITARTTVATIVVAVATQQQAVTASKKMSQRVAIVMTIKNVQLCFVITALQLQVQHPSRILFMVTPPVAVVISMKIRAKRMIAILTLVIKT
jgi:hypothetical protein